MNWLARLSDWFSQFWRPLIYFGDPSQGNFAVVISNGVKLFLRKNTIDKYIFWEIFKRHVYTNNNFLIKEGDTVVDIGAQAGIFSVFAASLARKGKVYSFEPFRENYELLLKNKNINNFENIHAFNMGVTGKGGKTRLYTSDTNTGGHSVIWKNTGKFVEINTITLSDIVQKTGKIDYLKIDAEGAEYDILLNSKAAIFTNIDRISFEYHDSGLHSHTKLLDILKRNGYITKIEGSFLRKRFLKTGIIKAKKKD